jgi:hypothetical protein
MQPQPPPAPAVDQPQSSRDTPSPATLPAAPPPPQSPDAVANGPIAVIVLGMAGDYNRFSVLFRTIYILAGSGKTTFMQQLLVQASAASKRS